MANYQTLITKIYGLHKMKIYKSKKGDKKEKLFFVVMGNLYSTSHKIHLSYDLKGSMYGRTAKI